jgi:signal transduction histidine kinase
MRKILLPLFALLANTAHCIDVDFDSLRSRYSEIKDDSARIEFLLNSIGYQYETVNTDSALFYYATAKQIAESNISKSNSFKKQLGDVHRNIGAVYLSLGNFIDARTEFSLATTIYKETGAKRALANTYIDIGISHYYQGIYNEAIQAYLQALDLLKEIGTKKTIATCYGNIAIVLVSQKKYDEALRYYYEALATVEDSGDLRAISYFYNNIGSLYQKIKDYDKALDYFNKSLEILEKLKDKKAIATCKSNIGLIYKNRKNFEKAIQSLEESSRIFSEINNVIGKAGVLNNLASAYNNYAEMQGSNNQRRDALLQKALEYGLESMKIAKKSDILPEMNRSAANLMEAYKGLKNHSKSLEYAELYIATQDSLYKKEKNKSLDELISKHEVEKLQKQQELDKEIIARHQEVNTKQRIIIIVSTSAFILVLFLLGLVVKFLRQRRKAYWELERKNRLLEQANEEIISQRDNLSELNVQLQQANEEIISQRDYLSELNEELSTKNHQLEQTQLKLVQSEKMASLGVLTAGIAHEINNPINFVFAGSNCLVRDFQDIKGAIEKMKLIENENFTAEEKLKQIKTTFEEYEFDEAISATEQTINDIRLGAKRAAEIVEGLKSFSRGESTDWVQYDLHNAIDGVLILLKNNYKNRIEIEKSFDPSLSFIEGRGGKFNQVIMNLLSNAIDAIDEEGTIFITTRKEKDNCVISIRDTGKGVPESIRTKIFDPFFTTKEVGKGTGLGLSITYGIITEHNGTLDLISEPEKGAEFIVTVPVRQKELTPEKK